MRRITVVFVHAIDVKFGPPQKTLRPIWLRAWLNYML